MPSLVVQSVSAGFGTSASARTLSFSSPVANGNLLVVIAAYSGTGITIAITDSLGNTYTRVADSGTNSAHDAIAMYYCVTASGGSNTVTLTPSGGSAYTAMSIAEYALVNRYATLKKSSTTTNGGLTNVSTPSLAASATNDAELKICGFSFDNGPMTLTNTTGILETIANATSSSLGSCLLDSIQNGNFTFSGSLSPSMGCCGVAASFSIFPLAYAPPVSIGPAIGSPMFRPISFAWPVTNIPGPPPPPNGALAYAPAVAIGPQPGTPMFRMFQKQAWTVVNFTPPPPPTFSLSSKVVVQSRLSMNSGLLSSGRRPDRPRLSES